MSFSKLDYIIKYRPDSANALALVGNYLAEAAASNRLNRLRLDPNLIKQISQIKSSIELATLISILLSEHILKRIIIVISPSGNSIAEYSSVDEVPEYIHDHLSDTQMQVTPDRIQTIYIAEV